MVESKVEQAISSPIQSSNYAPLYFVQQPFYSISQILKTLYGKRYGKMDNSRGRVNLSNISGSSCGVHSNNDKIKAYGSATWDSCREKTAYYRYLFNRRPLVISREIAF